MAPDLGQTATCAFTASASDEIFVSSPSDATWRVEVTRHGITSRYGRDDAGDCFLEGAFYSGRRMAVCSGRIRPGDTVTASAEEGARIVISNAVSATDPLYRG